MKTIHDVMQAVNQQVAEEARSAGQMTLGALISALESEPPENSLYFDFCNQRPGRLDSYRGFYEQLAISWDATDDPTVASFLEKCRTAIGASFDGYKGGDYRMDKDTFVWVSNYGTSSGSRIVGVLSGRWKATYLITAPYMD